MITSTAYAGRMGTPCRTCRLPWEADGYIFRHASKFPKDKQTVGHGLVIHGETRLTEAPSYDE